MLKKKKKSNVKRVKNDEIPDLLFVNIYSKFRSTLRDFGTL